MSFWERFSRDFDNRAPIYSQIMDLFSRSFARGEIPAGERAPSIREIAGFLNVNANTMQRVYREMEQAGLIISKRGTGFFFTEDESMRESLNEKMAGEAINRFLQEMRGLGFSDARIADVVAKSLENSENAQYEGGKTHGINAG